MIVLSLYKLIGEDITILLYVWTWALWLEWLKDEWEKSKDLEKKGW